MGGSRSLLAIFVSTSLMIIHDLDAIPCTIATDEADSPLIVATDPMLTLCITAQRLQPASWNCPHVLQFPGVVQHPKLPPRTLETHGPEVSAPWQRAAGAPVRQCIRTLASTKSLRSDAAVMASAASSGRTSCGMSSGYRLSM